MKLCLQRVREASVTVHAEPVGAIKSGLLILAGVEKGDTDEDARYLARKAAACRIFADEDGKMNLSVADTGGAVLVVSQFTLCADTRKGNRPGYVRAADPSDAVPLLKLFSVELQTLGVSVETGEFGADMQVSLVNDGPVTIVMESHGRATV